MCNKGFGGKRSVGEENRPMRVGRETIVLHAVDHADDGGADLARETHNALADSFVHGPETLGKPAIHDGGHRSLLSRFAEGLPGQQWNAHGLEVLGRDDLLVRDHAVAFIGRLVILDDEVGPSIEVCQGK